MSVFDLFHAYVFGTAFWYSLRASARVYDPLMVIGWFRPPAQQQLAPNDLEIYNVRTDAWGLYTLAAMLLILSGAVPLSFSSSSSSTEAAARAKRPYAKAAIAATMFHHVTTGIGAYEHYAKDSHYNTSMGIGVWGNVGLFLLGAVVLATDRGEGARAGKKGHKA